MRTSCRKLSFQKEKGFKTMIKAVLRLTKRPEAAVKALMAVLVLSLSVVGLAACGGGAEQ
jgi:hypothetical protein